MPNPRSHCPYLFVVLCTAFSIFVVSACSNADPKPSAGSPQRMVSSNDTTVVHDFGDVSLETGHQKRQHSFSITNETSSVMDILDLKKSCGCIDATIDKRRLNPNESAL